VLDRIFVSYRRSDSEGEAGRLFDDLLPFFGEQSVFMDVAAIEAGCDFRLAIEDGVSRCGVLLVMIGPEWLNTKDEAGARRLDSPKDFVRLEVAAALQRNIPVIPVLVRGAKMPAAEQLPGALTELAYRNCVELTHARWKSDLQLLVEALRRLVGDTKPAAKVEPPAPAVSDTPRRKTTTKKASKAAEAKAAHFDPAVLQRVNRELAFYVGQIAEILVKRTASRCASISDLYLRLAEEIDSPEEREEFLRNCPDSPGSL